jgi:hypothetical protein
MANFIPPAIITTDGNYEINTRPGREHLLTLKGTWAGATVTMTAYNDATGTYTSVDSGSWTADAEVRFIAPSGNIRLAMTNDDATTSIGVTLIQIVP